MTNATPIPTNLFVSKVSQTDGAVNVEYRALEESDLPETAITATTEFVYNYEEPDFQTGEETLPPEEEEGNEGEPTPANEELGEDEIVEIPAKTIQWLFDKVAALEARIYQLENPYALTHPIEEELDTPIEAPIPEEYRCYIKWKQDDKQYLNHQHNHQLLVYKNVNKLPPMEYQHPKYSPTQ